MACELSVAAYVILFPDQGLVPCIGGAESKSLDHQGNPRKLAFEWFLAAVYQVDRVENLGL